MVYATGPWSFSGTTLSDGHVFSANSLYDPDTTGTGHQPRGFDQLSALYKMYRVHTAEFLFTVVNTGASRMYVNVAPDTSSSTPTGLTPMEMLETRGKVVELEPAGDNAGRDKKIIYLKVNIPTFLGLKWSQFMDDDYAASTAANPSRQAFVKIAGRAWSTTAYSFDVTHVRILYRGRMYDRTRPASS